MAIFKGGIMKLFKTALIVFLFPIMVAGCATMGLEFDNVKKTNQLRPGMAYEEVVQLLGSPQSSGIAGEKFYARWRFHEAWKGFVFYDMVFDPASKRLVSWGPNEEEYQKSQKAMQQIADAFIQGGESGGTPRGPNDANLQQQIAGTWWGYAGSTERMVGLCPDGSYRDYTESSYSGKSYDQYGSQTMAWGSGGQRGGSGRWTINGNTQEGIIHVTYGDGNSMTLRYRQINDPGCLNFNGHILCRRSRSCQ